MRQQHEITTSGPLLGSDGNLLEPGWARSLLPVYRRADIKAGAMRVKEWDYYLITDGHIGLLPRGRGADALVPHGQISGQGADRGHCQAHG